MAEDNNILVIVFRARFVTTDRGVDDKVRRRRRWNVMWTDGTARCDAREAPSSSPPHRAIGAAGGEVATAALSRTAGRAHAHHRSRAIDYPAATAAAAGFH